MTYTKVFAVQQKYLNMCVSSGLIKSSEVRRLAARAYAMRCSGTPVHIIEQRLLMGNVLLGSVGYHGVTRLLIIKGKAAGTPTWLKSLSPGLARLLLIEGFTSKKQTINAICDGSFCPYGKSYREELAKWTGQKQRLLGLS